MNYIRHPKHVPFEYSKITNNIYLGTNQCCKLHFDKSLLKKGITAREAIKTVKQERGIHLRDSQINALKKFQKKLQNGIGDKR